MPIEAAGPTGESRRKRVRKGTKSCQECKRRKVKCIFRPDNPSVCAGCLSNGTACLSQEFAGSQPRERDVEVSALSLRMERVEALLEKIVYNTSKDIERNNTPSRASDVRLYATALGTPCNPRLSHQAPIDETEKLRQRLAELLPTQGDADLLRDSSRGWWLIQRHMLPYFPKAPNSDSERIFDIETVSRGHPTAIGRLLLCIAICIQQLSPGDAERLQTKLPLRDMMEANTSLVASTVTSDDDLTGNIAGVECLVLQGFYQTNAGNLQRGWLSFRKAVNVAHLMGLHRVPQKAFFEVPSLTESRRYYLWYQVLQGRYLSLVLGVPSATESVSFPFESVPWLSPEDLYHKQLCNISGLILARNQGDPAHCLSVTYDIDRKLEVVAQKMPSTWWQIPSYIIEGHTNDAASQYERIMCQIWHYELRTLLHLPFVVRAATDRRYEYSRICCLESSRSLIQRWILIRESKTPTLFSNLIEFQAFTSVVTLLLGHLAAYRRDPLNHSGPVLERDEDLRLVEKAARILGRLENFGIGMQFVNQGITVIHSLLDVLRQKAGFSDALNLKIPHYGIIRIARGGILQSAEGERMLDTNQNLEDMSAVAPSSRDVFTPAPVASDRETASTGGSLHVSGHTSFENHSVNSAASTGFSDSMLPHNAIFQFQSSQFPNFEEQPASIDGPEWLFGDNDVFALDTLMNSELEWSWNA